MQTDTPQPGEQEEPRWCDFRRPDCINDGVQIGKQWVCRNHYSAWALIAPHALATLTHELAEARAEWRTLYEGFCADIARLTQERDSAQEEADHFRTWLEHIRVNTGDEEDGGAFARDMAARALTSYPEVTHGA